jgi:hypothetical protein
MKDYGEWSRAAACLTMDPEVFARPRDDYEAREAKRVCQLACPVKHKCLAQAIIYKEVGIWGGYLESERRYISRASRKRLMTIAFLEDDLDHNLITDPVGIEIYNEIVTELKAPNKIVSNTDTYSGPMAA